MFKIGDKVVWKYELELVGTVRAKYRTRYLVGWSTGGRQRVVTAERDDVLLLAGSPLIPKLQDVERRFKELQKQMDDLDKEANKIIKGGKG